MSPIKTSPYMQVANFYFYNPFINRIKEGMDKVSLIGTSDCIKYGNEEKTTLTISSKIWCDVRRTLAGPVVDWYYSDPVTGGFTTAKDHSISSTPNFGSPVTNKRALGVLDRYLTATKLVNFANTAYEMTMDMAGVYDAPSLKERYARNLRTLLSPYFSMLNIRAAIRAVGDSYSFDKVEWLEFKSGTVVKDIKEGLKDYLYILPKSLSLDNWKDVMKVYCSLHEYCEGQTSVSIGAGVVLLLNRGEPYLQVEISGKSSHVERTLFQLLKGSTAMVAIASFITASSSQDGYSYFFDPMIPVGVYEAIRAATETSIAKVG